MATDDSFSQLSLFDNIQSDFPLPERIASGGIDWQSFPLPPQEHDGQTFYPVQDWIAGVAMPDSSPSEFWRKLKARMVKSGIELRTWCTKLSYTAENGRKYQIDHATAEGLYLITQRMDANTGIRNKILAYLAKAGVIADEFRRDPEKAISAGIAGYRRQGQSNDWIKERIETIDDYKLLCITVDRVCKAPRYGEIVNTEYRALYGLIAADLKALLNTKKIRDALPQLQLSYIHTAEIALRLLLDQSESMTNEDICRAAKAICEPLGAHLREVSRILRIHHITGKPLLAARITQ